MTHHADDSALEPADPHASRTGFARELHANPDLPTAAELRALAVSQGLQAGDGPESAEEIAGDGHGDIAPGGYGPENGGLMVVDEVAQPPAADELVRALAAHGEDAKAAAAAARPVSRQFDLENIFQYHAPSGQQLAQYARLRSAAYAFAVVLIQETPAGADQSAALRHIREAVMTGNAAIALGGTL